MNPRDSADPTLLAARDLLERRMIEAGIGSERPRIALVTGSGLGGFVESVQAAVSLEFGEIPGLAAGKVPGHAHRWIVGRVAGAPLHVLAGRRHVYEGIEAAEAVRAVRVLALLGVKLLILTNAAGGLVPRLAPGDLMLIRDVANLQMRSALRGANDESMGPRFPDMSRPFDPAASAIVRRAAEAERIALREGVYFALLGPTYETPAEVGWLRRLGADAVGMSTAPEVIAARHASMRVLALSLITNSHVLQSGPTTHEEVIAVGERGSERFCRLMAAALPRLAELTGSPAYERSD